MLQLKNNSQFTISALELSENKKSNEKHLYEIDTMFEVIGDRQNEGKVISPPPNNFILNKDGPHIDDFVVELELQRKMDYFYTPYNTGTVFERYMTFKDEPESIFKSPNQKFGNNKLVEYLVQKNIIRNNKYIPRPSK